MNKIAETNSKQIDPGRAAIISGLSPIIGGIYAGAKSDSVGQGISSGLKAMLGGLVGTQLLGMAAGRTPFKRGFRALDNAYRNYLRKHPPGFSAMPTRGRQAIVERRLGPKSQALHGADTPTQSLARILGAIGGSGATGYLDASRYNEGLEKPASLRTNTNMSTYHRTLYAKVAAMVDFNTASPEDLASFRKGTASAFNAKSWLDRNKMYRKMQGEADWADNAKARAMGSNFQAPAAASAPQRDRSGSAARILTGRLNASGPAAAAPTATPPAPSAAQISLQPLSNEPEYVAKGRPFSGNSQPSTPQLGLPRSSFAGWGGADAYSNNRPPASPAAPFRNVSRDQRDQAKNNPYAGGRRGRPAPAPAPTPPVDPQFQAFFNRAMRSR